MDIIDLQRKGSKNWLIFKGLDLSKIFKQRDTDWDAEHEYYIYLWKLYSKVHYIGKGKGNRFDEHRNDALANTIDARWTCEILAWGLTNEEALVLEAYLIRIASQERTLTHRGVYTWDGVSLINKVVPKTYRGVSYDVWFEKYLNLDGNNYFKTFRREVNGY